TSPEVWGHWRRAGIYDAVLLSKQSINRDENLLAAALCFWNSASNTFDFRVGPMAPTLLDMAQIFGFRPHGRPVDAVGDYHRRKNQEKVATPFTISPATINQNCSFSNYLKKFSAEKDKDQQHMLFLLYWLNRFVFPNRSSAVLLEYRHLAEALHNHTDVGLGPTVLAHLFKNLHTATLENPLNLSAPGAFWMIQIWLQVYFPELRFPDVVLPENQVLALPLISAEVPKRSLEEYLMLFRHCTKRSAAQWQVVIRRTYPWFQAGFRLFEREPEEENARTDFRKKFLSITLPRDLPHGGGKPPNYHLGAEVYHPNFCARQLGCPQLIPLKSYRSCNRASSWRDADDLEVHKDARCAVNKISNSTDALYPSWEPNSCSSPDFDAWWHARFQNLPASVTALKVLFDGWENWLVFADGEARAHMIQTIKDINAQTIEDPSLTKNVGGQSVQAGEVIVSSVIAAGDLELPSADEEDDIGAEQTPVEAVPSGRKKRKGAGIPGEFGTFQLWESFSPPTKLKKLKKKGEVEYFTAEEAAAIPVSPSGTDDELREAFEEVEQEKELQELEEVSQKKVAGSEDDIWQKHSIQTASVYPYYAQANGQAESSNKHGLTGEDYSQAMLLELEELDASRIDTLNKLLAGKQAVSRAYNKRVRDKSFEEGEIVWKAILPLGAHIAGYGKWSPTWEGPFVINQILGMGAYRLQDRDGVIHNAPINGKWLKKFYPTMWDSQAFAFLTEVPSGAAPLVDRGFCNSKAGLELQPCSAQGRWPWFGAQSSPKPVLHLPALCQLFLKLFNLLLQLIRSSLGLLISSHHLVQFCLLPSKVSQIGFVCSFAELRGLEGRLEILIAIVQIKHISGQA
ncbi:hypothetical protein Prudu_009610, partial [Prunus dulcis]